MKPGFNPTTPYIRHSREGGNPDVKESLYTNRSNADFSLQLSAISKLFPIFF
jgi:hypothetical protein